MSDSAPFELVAGRYRLESRIGSGRFGEVWRAADILLGRPVALKLMRPELAREQMATRRFQTEARQAGAIAHEAIVKIYDYNEGTPSQRPFLVMEYVPGSSLADELSAGPLGPARTMDLVAQIATGLDAAHAIGLVHGDIKPGNVLLGDGGRVKLTDFGVTFAPGATEDTMPETLLGTPEYQAPERMTGGKSNAATDLYSLGIVAYQCLTGRVPFRGRAVEVAHAHRSWPLPQLPDGTPPQVERLIAELTGKDPALRPASAREVARRAATLRDELALDPAGAGPQFWPASGFGPQAAGETAGPPPDSGGGPAPARRGPGRRRARALLGAGTVIVVVAACTGLVLADHRASKSGGAPAARLVDVESSALRGQPVSAVAARLRGQGLTVTIRWIAASGLPAGTVVSVQPSGWLAPGTAVVVTGAAAPGTTAGPRPGTSPVPASAVPGPFGPLPVAPSSPSHDSSPPTLTSSPPPSPTRTPTPSPSATPTPTSPTPTPSPSGSSGAIMGPVLTWAPAICAAPAAQWVTLAVAASSLPGRPATCGAIP